MRYLRFHSLLYDTFIEACASCVGTPFLHQGRLPGRRGGLDCVGLLMYGLEVAGHRVIEPEPYCMIPSCSALTAAMTSLFEVEDRNIAPQYGHLLQVVPPRQEQPTHLAIVLSDGRWLHALWRRGVVIQSPPRWHVAAMYRLGEDAWPQ